MKFPTIQVNSLFLALILAGIQVYILVEMNGKLGSHIDNGNLAALALVFAPTAAIAYTLRNFALLPNRCPKCKHKVGTPYNPDEEDE